MIINIEDRLKENQSVRSFARLLKLCEDQGRDILLNPIKYINAAYKMLTDVYREIERIYYGTRPPVPEFTDNFEYSSMESIRVPKVEWDRLKKLDVEFTKLWQKK